MRELAMTARVVLGDGVASRVQFAGAVSYRGLSRRFAGRPRGRSNFATRATSFSSRTHVRPIFCALMILALIIAVNLRAETRNRRAASTLPMTAISP